MLEDSARVQVSDCSYVNKQEQRNGRVCLQPLYNTQDVRKLVRRFEGARYGNLLKIAPRVTASFHDADRILGSASIRMKYTARGNTTTVLFSSDPGRSNMPILRDPDAPPPCDVLILESTYDDFFASRYIRVISSPEDSKRLNSMKSPCVVISDFRHTQPAPGKDCQVQRVFGPCGSTGSLSLRARNQAKPEQDYLVYREEKQALSLAVAIETEYPNIKITVPHVGATLEI
jgi:hypothetical protein